jgi:hypothetical protein
VVTVINQTGAPVTMPNIPPNQINAELTLESADISAF